MVMSNFAKKTSGGGAKPTPPPVPTPMILYLFSIDSTFPNRIGTGTNPKENVPPILTKRKYIKIILNARYYGHE